MQELVNSYGPQGLVVAIAILLSVIANRRIRALEIHDESQDIDHLEMLFMLFETGVIKRDFVFDFISRKRGEDRSASKSHLSDFLESIVT